MTSSSPVLPVEITPTREPSLEMPPALRKALKDLYAVPTGSKLPSRAEEIDEGRYSAGLGYRRGELDKLVRDDEGKLSIEKIEDLAAKFDPSTGTYSGVRGPMMRMAGVRETDITKTLGNAYQQLREQTPEYRKAVGLFPTKGAGKLSQLTSAEEIRDRIGANDKRNSLLDTLNDTVGGRTALTEARAGLAKGQKLNNRQLQSLLTEAKENTPKTQLDRKGSETDIKIGEQEIDASKDTVKLAEGRLALDQKNSAADITIRQDSNDITRVQAENNLEIASTKLELEKARLTGDTVRQQQLLDHQTQLSNNNIELQKALAQINSNDKQADREYDRERDNRDRRQALMVMLMQGLGNLGRSF